MNSETSRRHCTPGPNNLSSLTPKRLINSQFTIIRKLTSSSGLCDIYLSFDPISNQQIVLKVLKSQYNSFINNQSQTVIHEGQILNSISHQNIIKVLSDTFTTTEIQGKKRKEITYIPMEFAPYGNLLSLIQKSYSNNNSISENTCLFIFKQIITAVNYLHSNGICHRDIKLENILIGENYTIKLCDFEYADCFIKDNTLVKFKTKLGTERYMAPEFHYLNTEGSFYSGNCVDIFSCGIVLLAMLTGKMYFSTTSTSDFYYRMYTEDKSKFFSVISLPISTRSLDLIAKTLEQDFNLRPSAQEILDSDAFEGVDEMKAQKELESILSV